MFRGSFRRMAEQNAAHSAKFPVGHGLVFLHWERTGVTVRWPLPCSHHTVSDGGSGMMRRNLAWSIGSGLTASAVLFLQLGFTIRGGPSGVLEHDTLFTVYGRGFGVAPILGKLGTYSGFSDMDKDIQHPWVSEIDSLNGPKGVKIGVELIYAMGVPCGHSSEDCLDYLGRNIVPKYIEPAAARGWVVVLDTQLGRSNPVTQVRRMIDDGYLKYDNVHVAIDPEFHVVPGHSIPGIPIGSVEAAQINQVQKILSDYVSSRGLHTKKILIVHQFNQGMVRDKSSLRTYPNVELVINADGLGTPREKVEKYNLMTSARRYPFTQFRGIKVFYKDPGQHAGHFDKPPMTMPQVFGVTPIPGGRRMDYNPSVVIIA
jgi:hypothetical protein